MSTSPSSAGSSPASTRNSVDLPTPFAPTSPTCWAGVILNDTSANSRSPPGCAYARLETTTCDIAVQPRRTRAVAESGGRIPCKAAPATAGCQVIPRIGDYLLDAVDGHDGMPTDLGLTLGLAPR